MRNHETELQGQLQHIQQENTRINVLMNHIQIAISSMNTGNQELAKQFQTSNFKLHRLQTEVTHLRTSVERTQTTEGRDAEHLRNVREENTCLARENVRQLAEIERFILSLQEAQIESLCIKLKGKTRKILQAVGVALQKKCAQQMSDQKMLLC